MSIYCVSDYTIVHTNELQVRQEELMALFKNISESHIKCYLEKSQLVTEEIDFLGNVVSKNQIAPNPNRAKCLNNHPRPVLLKELQGWLGVANYQRNYIQGYAQPLNVIMELKKVPKSLRKKNCGPDGKKFGDRGNGEAVS